MRLKAITTMAMLMIIVSWGAPAVAQRDGAARPFIELPPAPLRNILVKHCTKCHGIDEYAFFALDRGAWKEFLDESHAGLEMTANHHEEELILDYLVENFGEEAVPFPREYMPPEITTYFDEQQGRSYLDTNCTECHETERVFEMRNDLERWRLVLLEMKGRGAYLENTEDLERMAEWLSRFQGINATE